MRQDIEARRQLLGGGWQVQVEGARVTARSDRGDFVMREYVCLHDTADPRGPKGK